MKSIAIVALPLLVACNGGGNAPTPSPSPIVEGCTPVASLPLQMLYPQPGATAIPSGHLQIWFGNKVNPGPLYSPPSIGPVGGNSLAQGGPYASPSPGPTPPGSATPAPGDQVYVSDFGATQLTLKTTYSVTVTTLQCRFGYTMGTFTTQ